MLPRYAALLKGVVKAHPNELATLPACRVSPLEAAGFTLACAPRALLVSGRLWYWE